MLIGVDASRVQAQARTGTETYSQYLIAHLIPLAAARGHTLRLYSRAPLEPATFDLETWPPHVHLRVLTLPRLWTHLALARELWRDPPEVLFIPAHVVPFLPPPHLPIAVTVHDLGYEHFPDTHRRRQRWYLRWSTRHSARRARAVIADSHATAQDLQTLYGLPPHKVRVIYPGSPQETASLDPADIAAVRAHYGIPGPYLVHVGTLQPRKNLIRLLQAFARVRDTPVLNERGRPIPGVLTLVLVGKAGWLADSIWQQIEGLGLRGRVLPLGYVPDPDLTALLSGALALVFPSLYEGFGFPVLEAHAVHVPVLTSTTSSLPEVAGDAALLVDPTDIDAIARGISRLLGDPALRQDLIRRGCANLARFSWSQTAEKVLTLLESLSQTKGDNHSHSGGKANQPEANGRINEPTNPKSEIRNPKSEIRNPQPLSFPADLATVHILGVRVHRLTFAQALDYLESLIAGGGKHQIVTVNPEIIMRARQEADYREILNRASMAWPDGVGLLMAAWLLGKPIPERVTGSDGLPLIAERAAQQGWRLYLLGAAPGIARRAAEVLHRRYPGLSVVGAEAGHPDPTWDDDLVARVNAVRPDILFVAYGAPRQERWIARNLPRLDVRVAIGVGGAFDFLVGRQKRAPQLVQRLGLEWLWRLLWEPRRWRRQLAIPLFTWHVLRQWCQEREEPRE